MALPGYFFDDALNRRTVCPLVFLYPGVETYGADIYLLDVHLNILYVSVSMSTIMFMYMFVLAVLFMIL